MSGREEQDIRREKWIEEKLKDDRAYLVDYMRSIKKKTSATRKAYLGYVIQYVNFMDSIGVNITEVKPMHVDRYIEYISNGNGPAIVNTKLAAIADYNKFLERNELISKNPCSSDMKLKIEEKDSVIYMTETEVDKIKSTTLDRKFKYKNRDLCIITLGCSTGLRVSAIVNIDIEDIDFDENTITVVEKGKKKRTIYIGNNTADMIRSWMDERESIVGNNQGPLFISQKKNRISVRAVQEMMQKVSKGMGKHITPHKMRSTCAMKLYEKTGDIYLTAQQLGHANIKNTMIYAKATEDRRREAAMILD